MHSCFLKWPLESPEQAHKGFAAEIFGIEKRMPHHVQKDLIIPLT